MTTYTCPYCGEEMTEEEAESAYDCGCGSCRRTIDWSDYPDQIEEDDESLQDIL